MFIFIRNRVIYAIVVFNFIYAQINSIPTQLLNNAGVSKEQAKDIIQKELGLDLDKVRDSKETKNDVDIDEIKDIIESDEVLNVNQEDKIVVDPDVELEDLKENSSWNPPPITSDNIDNLYYEFDNYIYKWNGDAWVVDSEINSRRKVISNSAGLPKYFGYDSFNSNPNVFTESNLDNVDPDYLIGPGDEVIILLWGQVEQNKPYIVTKDGYIFIEELGQVFVNGYTLEKLEQKLLKLLKKIYSSLNNTSGSASTFFDVSLGKTLLKPMRIFVMGEVSNPGAYNLGHSSTLFSSIFFFGGPKTSGSLREISLIRDGKEIAIIDFYDFLLSGKKINDLRIQRNDIIFIKPRGKTVKVSGEILRPFIFELKKDEKLSDLITMAGGLLSTTYRKRIQIDRIIAPTERLGSSVDRKIIDLDLSSLTDNKKESQLYDGDKVVFYKISDMRSNSVNLEGAVIRPGLYALEENMTIVDLINSADGLVATAYKEKVDLTRTNEDFTSSLIDIDLDLAFDGDKANNILLQDKDRIKIYNEAEMIYRQSVKIEGHVFNPGVKTYKTGMTVFDLIFEGGGFENEMHLKKTYLDKAELHSIDQNGEDKNIVSFRLDSVLVGRGIANNLMKMGDKIRIYSREEVKGSIAKSVQIIGSVKRPNFYPLSEGMRLKDLLFMAGGFDDNEFMTGVFMKRADLIRTEADLISKKVIPFDLEDALDSLSGFDNFLLQDNDLIRIYSNGIFKIRDYVEIEGTVNVPGRYELKKGMTVEDLILEAGGISNENLQVRIDIASRIKNKKNNIRSSKRENYVNISTFYLDNIAKTYSFGSKAISNLLIADDVVTVRPDPNILNRQFVEVQGLVKYPGKYILEHSDEKISDIIDRAGGLLPQGNPESSFISRGGERINLSFAKLLQSPRSKTNVRVKDGDLLSIGVFTELVKIEGAVNNPGNYQYIKGLRLSHYIKKAGGYTREASRFATFVNHPDGTSRKVGLIKFSPHIHDGSNIVVGTKVQVQKFNFTEYVTNLTDIWADLSQAYLMIILAGRSS